MATFASALSAHRAAVTSLDDGPPAPFSDLAVARLAFRAFARDIVRVFRLDMESIKAALKARLLAVPYHLPYEPTHPWE